MTDITQLTMFRQKDVEKLFAACAFVDPVNAIQQCGWLRPEIILNEQVRAFWSSIRERITIDMAGTDRALEEVLKIGMETGLQSELMAWTNEVTYSTLPLPYANEISRRAYMTGISSKFGELVKAVSAGDDQETRKIIHAMDETDIGGSLRMPIAYDVAQMFDRIVTEGVRSVKTWITPIDTATGGLERQTLSILAARPSTGKTAMAWQIAQQCAFDGQSVLFFSLEMSAANLWGRAACPKVGTTWRDVRAGKLNQEQKERLLEESYALAGQFESRLKIVDTPQTTETIWQAVAQERPALVVVDHLRLVKDTHTSEVKRLGQITQRLKDLAKNFGCAVLLCAQLNRQSEARAEKRPMLADLRDSGEIEENGDLILMLHREDSGLGFAKERSQVELWVRKFRDGPRDVLINLIFDMRNEWFEAKER